MNDENNALALATLAIRSAELRTDEMAHSETLFLTSSFVYESAAQAAGRFDGSQPGNVYSRFSNPTVRAFEQRLAAMEGGERAVAFGSGMGAIFGLFFALLSPGEHVVSSRSLFGTTNSVFRRYFTKFGLEYTLVDIDDLEAWRQAIRPNTRFLYLETPSNPLAEVGDIRALAELAHEHEAELIVDNCFCTPVVQKPLALGADYVIHSATKYLDGQGRCVGGAVVGRHDALEEVFAFLRTTGASLSPFNAWVFLKGLETLPIRMRAHCDNALALARWLEQQEGVEHVYYSGLESHPNHELASKQQNGYGGVLSFTLVNPEGSREREVAWRFIDATKMISITANLGDVKTTITHPASTTHGRLTPEEKQEAGITENLIRLSVGLEDIEDLKQEMRRGLTAIGYA
mgnify:CR=1 FL=1